MEFVTQQPQQQSYPKWIPILIVLCLVLLGVGYVLRLLTPKTVPSQPLLTQNFDDSKSTFKNLIFTGTAPNIPGQLPTGIIKEVQRSSQDIEESIIAKHHLQPKTEYGGIWASDEYTLTKISRPEMYFLTQKNLSTPLEKGILTEKAVATATQYVQDVFKNKNIGPIKNQIVYYLLDTVTPHPEVVTSEIEANAVEIPFSYTYGPYPIFLEKDFNYPLVFTINSNYTVQKLTFQPFTLEFTDGENYKTISVQQALGNIIAGNGALIISSGNNAKNPLLDQIVAGNFESVVIEYRADSSSKTLIPYYHFSGNLKNDQNETFYAEVITPAIQTNFNQP